MEKSERFDSACRRRESLRLGGGLGSWWEGSWWEGSWWEGSSKEDRRLFGSWEGYVMEDWRLFGSLDGIESEHERWVVWGDWENSIGSPIPGSPEVPGVSAVLGRRPPLLPLYDPQQQALGATMQMLRVITRTLRATIRMLRGRLFISSRSIVIVLFYH
eukprot:6362620-Pyramimonas_sp.AAC.1